MKTTNTLKKQNLAKWMAMIVLVSLTGLAYGQNCTFYINETFTISGNPSTTVFCPGSSAVYTAVGFPGTASWSVSGGSYTQSGNTITVTWAGSGSVSAYGSWQTGPYFDDGNECPTGNYYYENTSYTSNTISISPPYVPYITPGGPTTFCSGGSVNLTAGGTPGGSTFQWKKDGAVIPGGAGATDYVLPAYVGVTQYIASNSVKLTSTPGFSFKAGVTGTSFRASIAPFTTAINYVASQTGAYSVAVTSAGCTIETSLANVNVLSLPPVPSVASSTTTLAPGVFMLTASNGSVLQWLKNNVPISGATSTKLNVTASGDYKVTNTVNTCVSSSNTVTVAAINNQNYVTENVLTVPGLTTDTQVFSQSLTSGVVLQNMNYLNGQGKPLQSIAVASSPTLKDVLQPYTYDVLGRSIQSFLPMATSQSDGSYRPNAIETSPGAGNYSASEHYAFYTTGSPIVAKDAQPYELPETELSPLGRVIKQGAVGAAFQTTGAFKTISYGTNTNGISLLNDIRKWSITGLLPNGSSTWPANALSLTKISDEAGVESETYSNRGLKIVERTKADGTNWAETYYIYDQRDNLRCVLPPELMKLLRAASNFNPTQAQLDTWANQYVYDVRGRVVETKKPGATIPWVYSVYDNRDRVVLTQDGKQRTSNQWSYTKYDELNRPVISGIYSPGSAITRTTMQATVDALNGSLGYANLSSPSASATVFPTTNDDPLVITYYDTYTNCTFCALPAYQFVSENWNGITSNEPFAKTDQVFGRAVAGSVKILGTATWLNSVSYFNKQGQEIQTISSDHLGGTERFSTLPDFSGKVLATVNNYIGLTVAVSTVRRRYDYDLAGRLLKTYHQVNSQPEVILSQNQYNELGQLIDKSIHSANGSPYLQSIDYRYGIRGWLSKVNFDTDATDPFPDYFGMEMGYNNTFAGLSPGRPDGLVSGIKWKQDHSTKEFGYGYGYNNFGWLTSSAFKKNDNNSWTSQSNFYNENETYDYNGNIQTLYRYTKSFGAGYTADGVDQLTYNYGSGGNQLMKVSDGSPSVNKSLGFKDGVNAGDDYAYDINGNLTQDLNKGIVITYNFQNLVDRITFTSTNSYFQYTYDAGGTKLSEAFFNSANVLQNRKDYVGELILWKDLVQTTSNVLFITHEEGRLVMPDNTNLVASTTRDANSLEGYTANLNVTLTSEYLNLNTYVKAVCNQGTNTPGIFPIGGSAGVFTVKPGEAYTLKVMGYQSVGTSAKLYVWGNTGDIVWASAPALPVGSASEAYTSSSFIVPAGVTQIKIGVLWSAPAVGNTVYINEVKLYKSDLEYQYFLADQVGSPRVVLSSAPATLTFAATMEAENFTNENAQWLNLNPAISPPPREINIVANATLGGNEVLRMSSANRIGPARSMKVFPGDVVNANVMAYYGAMSGLTQTTTAIMAAAVQAILTGGVGGGIDANITNAYNTTGNPAISLSPFQGTTKPSAFLNYILFDESYMVLEAKSAPLGATAGVLHQVVLPQVNVKETGYLFVYLSYDNESTSPVFFDELKIIYQESPLIQVNNYYPFGLVSTEWVRSGDTDNNFLFQGKEMNDQTGWQDFGSRQYAGDLGRWFATDPAGQFASPYMAMGNSPTIGIDPDGEFFFVPIIVAGLIAGIKAGIDYTNARNKGLSVADAINYAGLNLAISVAARGLVAPGIVTNTLLQAGLTVASNGISNTFLSQPFFQNWESNAIFGGITGGINGYRLAANSSYERSLLFGTKTPEGMKQTLEDVFEKNLSADGKTPVEIGSKKNLPKGWTYKNGAMVSPEGRIAYGYSPYDPKTYKFDSDGRLISSNGKIWIAQSRLRNFNRGFVTFGHEVEHIRLYKNGRFWDWYQDLNSNNAERLGEIVAWNWQIRNAPTRSLRNWSVQLFNSLKNSWYGN